MRENIPGTIYLVHLAEPYDAGQRYGRPHAARHYCGWTAQPVEERLHIHRRGDGSPFLRAAVKRGIALLLVRTWSGTRHLERRIKNVKRLAKFCPECNPTAHRNGEGWL